MAEKFPLYDGDKGGTVDTVSLRIVRSELHFLDRLPIYEIEKPYRMRYVRDTTLPMSNIKPLSTVVEIGDSRPGIAHLSLDTTGFEVHDIKSDMQYSDFENPEKIQEIYLRELRNHLKQKLRAAHVCLLDYELRRRHPLFPISTGEKYEHSQPNSLAHVDVTLDSVKDIVRKLYGTSADKIPDSRVICVTAWKPLTGPLKDWPLAMCDARTLDANKDTVSADIIYRNFIGENYMVHYAKHQKWYFLADQNPSELLVFKAADSGDPNFAG